MPSLDQDPFRQWMDGARRGEGQAWDALYREFAPLVLGFLRARNAPAPEDMLAEVWLQVVRDLDRFDGTSGGFRGWILRIANNRLVDAHRASGRRVDEVPVADLPERAGVEDVALPVDDAHELERLFEGLPDTQRAVLYLRYVLDMPQREIADVLGVSTAAVKMQQRRGIDAISRRLDRGTTS